MDCKYLLSDFYLIACEKKLTVMQAYEEHPSKAYSYLNSILNMTWKLPGSKFNREYRRNRSFDEQRFEDVNSGLNIEEKQVIEDKINTMIESRLKAILKEPKTIQHVYTIYQREKTYKSTAYLTGLKIKEVKQIIQRIHGRAKREYYSNTRSN